ncbi:MAG: hypothetical protein KAU50_03960 [Candidatus Marinimicrobia bacterium]|nr:hypothetical protein [Candidatus Neomarinimicrobiota bacterium]
METSNKKLSPKAQKAWDNLDGKTRKEIQKDNPFRWQRNKRIRELRAKGITVQVLEEITGFYRGSIYRIIETKPLMTEYQKQEITSLVETFEALLNTLNRLLTDKSQRRDERNKY